MRRLILCLFAALALFPAYLTAPAQKFQPKTIQFKGDPEHSDQELLAAAGLKEGVILTSAEMNGHSKALMDSGVFDNLTYKFDGVDLIYYLTPAEHLYPIRLENLPIATGEDLDAQLHERFPLYHGKVPAEGTLLDTVRSALEEMLAAEGIMAKVEANPTGNAKTHKVDTMTFSISAPEVHASIARIEGLIPEFKDKVERLLANAAKNPFITSDTAPFLERSVEFFYQDQGYAAVKVSAERAGAASLAVDGILVPFTVKIEPGKLYKVGAIHLPPDAPLKQAEIDQALAPAPAGQRDGVRLRGLWILIAQRYHNKGYLDCAVKPAPQFDDAAGVVNYNVAIETGSVYHLAFVKFDNVSDQMRALLIRSWQMMPGDPFDESYVSNFIYKAGQQDPVLLRSLVGVKAKYDVMADPQTHDVNVVMRLEKR